MNFVVIVKFLIQTQGQMFVQKVLSYVNLTYSLTQT